MKRAFAVLATAVVVALAPGLVFAQTGPAGNWELSMETPQGANTVGLSIALAGDKVSGELSSQLGAVPVSGTATGNDVALSAEVNIQGMALTFGINGKVDGDTMNGSVKVGDFGEFPFTGKRTEKTAAAAPPAGAAAAAAAAPAAAPDAGTATSGAPITDLNGKWDVKLTIQGVGEIPATAVIKQALRGGSASPWLIKLLARKPPKLAAVALANKTARIAWKLMVTGQSYAIKTKPAATVGAV